MAKIKFTRQQTETMVDKLQTYFEQNLEQPIGQFEAEFLLEFFAENLGSHYYNQGLTDAQQVIENQVELINDALYAIEKPVN